MKLADILKLEQENTGLILHNEGLFYRAYEKPAFLFGGHTLA